MSKTLAQTYVWHEGHGFFVSTINRRSSAALAHGAEYAETIVWEWDGKTRERNRIVGQGESSKDSIYTHQKLVERLYRTGSCDEPEDA